MSNKGKRLLLHFVIEFLLYAILLAIYYVVVLRFLNQPLHELFLTNTPLYATATLVVIVIQSVFLEWVTSLLVRWLGMEAVE
ncbi:MAG: hypothetical protein KC425_22455 [Anaerolineales bacterium]|nr:hypothetical protein [Anaerolineales bacterium]